MAAIASSRHDRNGEGLFKISSGLAPVPYTKLKLATECYHEHCEIRTVPYWTMYMSTHLNTTQLNKTEPSRGTGDLVFDEPNIFQTKTTYFLHSSSHLIYNTMSYTGIMRCT